jgi:hypothetical protein
LKKARPGRTVEGHRRGERAAAGFATRPHLRGQHNPYGPQTSLRRFGARFAPGHALAPRGGPEPQPGRPIAERFRFRRGQCELALRPLRRVRVGTGRADAVRHQWPRCLDVGANPFALRVDAPAPRAPQNALALARFPPLVCDAGPVLLAQQKRRSRIAPLQWADRPIYGRRQNTRHVTLRLGDESLHWRVRLPRSRGDILRPWRIAVLA